MSCFNCNAKLHLSDTLICIQCSHAFHYICCDLPKEEFNKWSKNPTDWICSNCKSKEQTLNKIAKDDPNVLERAIVASIRASFDDTNARITKLQSLLIDCIRHNDELFLKVRSMHEDLNYLKLKVDSISDVRLSPASVSRRSSDNSDTDGIKRNWFHAAVPIIYYKLKDSKLVRRILKDLAKLSFVAIRWVFSGTENSLQMDKRPTIRCKRFATIKSQESKQDGSA
uniref:PHD finger protein 12 n=1 Tax=Lygus hesperus TaxID=30085 RepID=A0A0A9YRP5_LYGHE